MKKILPLALILVLLVAAASARANARPDFEFGTKGKVLLRDGMRVPNASALLPDGRVVVAQYRQMVAYLPSGRIDQGFGEGGSASLLVPPGSSSAAIADVLVDSQGRLVVVGSADNDVLVARYLPDGRLDSSFGGGDGYTLTTFGLPPMDPEIPSTIFVPPPTDVPLLSAFAATLDRSDRVLVTGLRQEGHQQVKTFWIGAYEAFVARFTAEGEEDKGFGGDGVIQLPGYDRVGRPLADADGGVFLIASRPSGNVLLHLSSNGAADSGFGQNGGRPAPGESIVGNSGDGLLLSGRLEASGENRVVVKRLRPDATLDRSFGRRGAVTLRLPRLQTARLAVDSSGGILVGFIQSEERNSRKRANAPAGLALARVRPDGSFDKSFGRRGIVAIPLGRGWKVRLSGLGANGSEALLTGGWCGGGDCGTVLAKVDLGSG